MFLLKNNLLTNLVIYLKRFVVGVGLLRPFHCCSNLINLRCMFKRDVC